MERIGIDKHLIDLTKALYKNPEFRVNISGNTSEWKKQHTGIRQGCPLSPYLFLIVMTVMFHDLHKDDHLNLIRHRPANCNFNEILHADDTILVGRDTRTLNKCFAALYGLKLNKAKCVAICMYGNPNIKFQDGTRMDKVEEAMYLGVKLNKTLDLKTEIASRIKNTMVTWKRLGDFWKQGNVSNKDKLTVYNAVIRCKLLYGLESAQLNYTQLLKINTVQLKGFRQILNITTTYVDRTHTNDFVIAKAQELCKGEVQFKLFSEYYQQQRLELLGHIIRETDDCPEQKYSNLQ